jgi:hypothetical protein
MRGSLHGVVGEGNHFVIRLITKTNTFFDTDGGLYGAKISLDVIVTSSAAQKY